MKNEKIAEFLKENKLYREYNPKNYIKKVDLKRELGFMDNSVKACLSVKPSSSALKKYKSMSFETDRKFGILVCIKNTDEDSLRQMIESVLAQTYENFRFYIIDKSDRAHAYIANICMDYTDERIIYRRVGENFVLKWDFLACDYVVFLNEVDALCPHYLSRCMSVLDNENCDVIYTNTGMFRKKMFNIYNCILKPDYARINLSTYNYIGDNIVATKHLFDDNSEYAINSESGSYYSLFLAILYQAVSIKHLRETLYLENGSKVIKKRIYEREPDLNYKPMVSVIVKSDDSLDNMSLILTSLKDVTDYDNLEIIVVENDEGDRDKSKLYRFYKLLSSEKNIRFLKVLKERRKSAIYNYAAAHAKGEYLVFLDSRCEVVNNTWIEKLLCYVREDNVAIASPKVLNHKSDFVYAGAYLTGKRSKIVYEKDRNKDFARNVSAACELCMIISKDTFSRLSGFDTDFENDYMIADLSIRALKENYDVAYVADSFICFDGTVRFDSDDREHFEEKNGEVLKYDRYREW